MLWSNNAGTTVEDEETGEIFYFPLGNEIGSSAYSPEDDNEFLILSDHNRGEIGFSNNRIESRERMVNGRMRSYYVADKLSVSTSWDMLPSRAYELYPSFNSNGQALTVDSVEIGGDVKPVKPSGSPYYKDQQFTVDGGAGGADMLEWYEKYKMIIVAETINIIPAKVFFNPSDLGWELYFSFILSESQW
jgi:hypothetical protein